MKTLTDKIVIFEAFLLHAITCALFWIGQIPNLIFAILNASGSDSYQKKESYMVITIMNNATCFLG
jgi:hypothetical protein